MRRRLRLSLILTGTLVGLLTAGPAWAHSASLFYPYTWSTSQRGAVTIYNNSTVTGSFLSRVLDGAKAWDKIGTSHDFHYKGQASLSKKVCDAASRGKNLVYKTTIDGKGGTAGITETCFSGGRLVRFVMRFDSAENWWSSTTTPTVGRIDLWSVAAHEFGHATGWRKHLDGVTGVVSCGNKPSQETMCATNYAGTTQQRSLGAHDVHTFDAVY